MNNTVEINNIEQALSIIAKNVGKKVHEVAIDSDLASLCKGNVYKLGLLLLDFSEHTNSPFTYDENDEFSKFATVHDIIEYFKIEDK